MVDPENDDAHHAYESNAVRNDPNVSVGAAQEVGDGNFRRVSSSSDLDVQSLLDQITTVVGENMFVKRDLAEKDKQI